VYRISTVSDAALKVRDTDGCGHPPALARDFVKTEVVPFLLESGNE
jgi:hypothetical protein